MNGFLHGANFGECIAAEIAATKRVEEIGLRALQVSAEPFVFFGHREWRQRPDGRWRHGQPNVPDPLTARSPWRVMLERLRTAVH